MKITLIRPNMGVKNGQNYKDIGSMEPYALAIIAGITPPEVEVVMFDDRLESIPYDDPTDLVAITVETFTAKRAYHIAVEYRKRGVPVVIGGFHASLIPQEVAEYADAVVVGEVEPVWLTILEDARHNKLAKFYHTGFKCNLAGFQANRSIYKNKKYIPITLTHFSRGCPFSCTYCPDAVLYQGSLRYRPIPEVLAEIEQQEHDFVFLVDNNISADKKKFKSFLKAIMPLGIKWISQTDVRVADDPNLLKLMQKSGCVGLVIGFETLDKNNLSMMNKPQNINHLTRYDDLVKRIHDHGIAMWAAFLLGYDADTKDTFNIVLEFALKHKFFFAAFNQLIPYYGTPIYQKLAQQKRLLFDKWWLDENYRFGYSTFLPKNMSPEELTLGCMQARMTFNSFGNILRRGTNFKANFMKMKIFLKYTYLFRKECINKQNIVLGIKQ
jgi:radical SAM superfamily enzyme YgiQ (UPF0313 family)